MTSNSKLGGFLLLVTFAAAGYGVITFLPWVIEQYEEARAFNHYWGYIYLGISLAVAAMFAVLFGWSAWTLLANTRTKRRQRESIARSPSQLSRAQQEREIAEHFAAGKQIADDPSLPADARAPIRESIGQLEEKMERQRLEIVAFGTISSGKSSLLNALAGQEVFRTDARGGTTVTRNEIPWTGGDQVFLVDTPGLAEIDGHQRQDLAKQSARDADLVLLVVDGPLKEFEFDLLRQLGDMEKRVLICLNKQDWYRREDQALLREQIAEQASRWVKPDDVVALSAQPTARVRVRVLPDGSETEESVDVEPDIQQLAGRMMAVLKRESKEILLANLLLRSRGMVSEARGRVQQALDEQADQVVDRTMWQAGGAAALSPLPLVDVAVGLAISSKMVFALAKIYRQPIDLETATRLVSELGKNLVAILGTTMATPAIGSAVASLLKSVPGAGTIAGGVLQGLVQALVTRWIGKVFIVYFRNEMQVPETGWVGLARAKWNEVTRPAELAKLVTLGLKRFGKGGQS